jgi:hypothetical protein
MAPPVAFRAGPLLVPYTIGLLVLPAEDAAGPISARVRLTPDHAARKIAKFLASNFPEPKWLSMPFLLRITSVPVGSFS